MDKTTLRKIAHNDEHLNTIWFDLKFPDCPFRLAFLKTWKTLPIQDFFWKPTKSEIWEAFDDARSNYSGLDDVYDNTFHRLALIYNDIDNKKDIVFREHHDCINSLPSSYPRCFRKLRDDMLVMEPMEGFCESLISVWCPAQLM